MNAKSRNERRKIFKLVAQEVRPFKHALEQEKGRSDRLKQELDLSSKRDADRLAAMAQKDDSISIAAERLAEARAERDRLVRMVDQFTSVSIIPHGANLALANVMNMPGQLRRT